MEKAWLFSAPAGKGASLQGTLHGDPASPGLTSPEESDAQPSAGGPRPVTPHGHWAKGLWMMKTTLSGERRAATCSISGISTVVAHDSQMLSPQPPLPTPLLSPTHRVWISHGQHLKQ